mgnify:CR=1 FL=1
MVSNQSKKFSEGVVSTTINTLEVLNPQELASLMRNSEGFHSKIVRALNILRVEELECLKKNNTQQTI